MKFKNLYLPIYISLWSVFIFLQSCEEAPKKTPTKKINTTEIDRLLELGYKYNDKAKFDSSYYYFNKAKYAAEVKKDTSRIIHSLGWMAQIQNNFGDYSASETTLTEAFPLLKNTKKYPYGIYNIYITMGNTYLFTFNYDKALFYYKKILTFENDKLNRLLIKNNIATVYMEKKEYGKAVQLLLPLISKKEILNDSLNYVKILDNLGYCYYKVGNSKGIDYLNLALKINKKIKSDWKVSANYYRLSEYYEKKNPDLAYNYAYLAYKNATKINAVNDRLLSLALLIKNSNGNQLKEFSLNYVHINDSITKVRQMARNQFAKMKYDYKKEKEENEMLKAQTALVHEKQKNKNLLFLFIICAGSSITLLLYFYLTLKNKKEKIKTSYETETRISKKLHDELANDVYQTMAFTETQDLSSLENREVLLNNLDAIYSRTRNISKENSVIETGIHFVTNLKEMLSSFNTNEVNVLINGLDTINWSTMEISKKITVYRVLQELLVNMKKHSQCSLAVITFNKNENRLKIDYNDNGAVKSKEEINLKNGLLNIESRIQAIKGTFAFDAKSNKGFKVSFSFPI